MYFLSKARSCYPKHCSAALLPQNHTPTPRCRSVLPQSLHLHVLKGIPPERIPTSALVREGRGRRRRFSLTFPLNTAVVGPYRQVYGSLSGEKWPIIGSISKRKSAGWKYVGGGGTAGDIQRRGMWSGAATPDSSPSSLSMLPPAPALAGCLIACRSGVAGSTVTEQGFRW